MMNWKQLEPLRSELLKNQLLRISQTPDLSADIAEIVHRALEL